MKEINHKEMQSNEICEDLRYNLNEIIDFLPDATFIIDQDGKVSAWNRAMEEITKIKAEDVLGKSDNEYSLPFYGTLRPLLINLALKPQLEYEKNYLFFERVNDTITAEFFIPHLKPGGVYLWAKACPLYDPRGKIVGAIETIRDITDRIIAEQKLKKSEQILKERVKKLNCLYGLTKLIDNPTISVDEILMGALQLVANAFQFPELACISINFNNKTYNTKNFQITPWKLLHKIDFKDKEIKIEVYYIEDKPFLEEETKFLDQILNQIKSIFEFKLDWIK